MLTSARMTPPDDYPDTLAVANLKGGCGKTTTTVFLGEAIAATGLSVAVLDTDPQASAHKWAGRADERGDPLTPTYSQPQPGESIAEAAARLREDSGADLVLIDTPPGAGDRDITLEAVSVSTGVIVPCRASTVEARELRPTFTLAREAGSPAVVLRIAVDLRMKASKGFGQALEESGIQVFRNAIPYNARMLEAGSGRPDKLYGYQWVWSEILGDNDPELPI